MGFTKWLLKNGVGSIGNTTKTWTKIYLDTIKDLGHGGKKEASYIHVIMSYTLANQKVREFYSTDPTLLLDKSDGCLAMLMWTLICEIPSNINAILSDAKHFDNSSDVIYQCVMELAPHEILMTPSQYRVMALEYLNYRDNVARALKSNNNIVETKYRTAVINRLDRQTEVYNNQFFNDAKDRFLSLTMDYTAEEYSIWTIEMNSNKYVYVHFSNDNSLKLNLNISAKQLSGKIRFPGIDY